MNNNKSMVFSKGYFACLYTFEIGYNKTLNISQVIQRLKNRDISAESDFKEVEYIDIAKDNSFSDKLSNDFRRVRLDDIGFEFKYKNSQKDVKCEVYFSFDPNCNIGNLFLNLDIKDMNTDNLIFLRQLFYGKFKCEYIKIAKKKIEYSFRINDTIDSLIDLIICSIHNIDKQKVANEYLIYHIIDIRNIKGKHIFNESVEKYLVDNYSNEVYGLLTCDEGYRFVPDDSLSTGIKDHWTSRVFLSIFSSNYASVMFNLTDTNLYDDYLNSQVALRNDHGVILEEYFSKLHYSKLAGINHDLLLQVENISIIRLYINQILSDQLLKAKSNIVETIIRRKNIVNIINKASNFGIMEIDNFESIISNNMQINKDIEKVKYNLDIKENELIIKYERMTNILFVFLSIIGIILTILQLY